MSTLIEVILPVFLVIGIGYAAVWRQLLSTAAVDGLMNFAIKFAIPCLLFLAISKLDLSANFNWPLMLSFYGGAFAGFGLGFLGARILFERNTQDSIAIGFVALFSNTVLLGLPIVDRAYGAQSLASSYAIVSVHALLIYGFGITAMEISKLNNKGGAAAIPRKVFGSVFHNPILIGIMLGYLTNVTSLELPAALTGAISILSVAALPVALFALGGTLVRYQPEGDKLAILWVTAVSLLVHPTITYILGRWVFELDQSQFRAAVLLAAMAPGINGYLFAAMYGAAQRVAASSVLVATAFSILSVWGWLTILP